MGLDSIFQREDQEFLDIQECESDTRSFRFQKKKGRPGHELRFLVVREVNTLKERCQTHCR